MMTSSNGNIVFDVCGRSTFTKWPLSTHSNNGNEYSRQYEWYAMTRLVEWTIYRPLSHLADNNWLESSDAFMSQCSGSLSIRQWCNLIHIVNWNCCIKLQGNFNWNSNIFIQEKYNWKCRLHNVGRFGPTSLLLIMQGVLSSRAMHTLDVTFSDIETATSCWGASMRVSLSISFFGEMGGVGEWKIHDIPWNIHTGFLCFVLLWLYHSPWWMLRFFFSINFNRFVLYIYIFFRVASLALGQSCDCPSASEVTLKNMGKTLQWRHNGRDSVSIHQPHDCLLNHWFRRRSKKTSKLRVTGLCAGNSPVNSPHKWPVMRKMFSFDDVIVSSIIKSRKHNKARTVWIIHGIYSTWLTLLHSNPNYIYKNFWNVM